MKLNKRERNLLIGLGVVLLLWGYYKFIISFQLKSLEAKREDKAHYENELLKIQTIVSSEKEIDNKFEHLNEEMELLSEKYFSEIDQSRFIVLFNELLEGIDLFVQNISFSQPREEGIGDLLVDAMSVTLPYEGKYSSLLSFLERVREYKPKTVIKNLSITTKENDLLGGNVLLDFYSLPDLIPDDSIKHLFDSSEINPDPFYSFEEQYIIGDDYYGAIDLSGVSINFNSSRVLIEGFDNKALNFAPSHPSIKCEIAPNINSKQGTSSLGLYYNFPPIQDEKYIYVALNNGEGIISQPPENIGMWVHSSDATGHSMKLRIKDREGNKYNISLYENIDWIGWKHLEASIPQESSLYPMEVEHIVVEIDSADDGKGTLLFDALEAFYIIKDIPVIDGNSIGNYRLYDVQVGDTLSSISKAFYNDTSYQSTIKIYNGINSNNDLKPGRRIIIPDA
ncbi:MAG TPA: LysM peptidoglycan-binding domain-containing protein [Clostridia bacterium]|nr:LysM peptidoglycan-binding domain-containing protein [Clostridia bacterium]